MTNTKTIPVAEDLFTWPSDDPRLIGSQCADCGLVAFPAADLCARCGSGKTDRRTLANEGTLWTFTTQGFRPPTPPYNGNDTAETFQPYTVGYVELADGLLVEARLTEPDPEALTIGQRMRMVVLPYSVADDGTQILTFAFAPAGAVAEEA
ncbi:Zn-ribbon domain-containing OB-fold protein [Streptomyces gilvus]|uniref:Zn-ribbon domain-containing OB-fold protein n=1 Tax=Streptomyces gilvus TaxID=2920937 RepID=UPI001F0D6392|nr:OB-fold domain-containing protein [Streptomyces sp. CME 23]MCH5675573.1 OB-fold domain-containing protein [Streptomyces sp. CME 23]